MLVTFVDLLRASLRCIEDFGPGYSPGPSKQKDGLFVLNAMIELLSIDRLNISGIIGDIYQLTPGQQDYIIGPTAKDWKTSRPIRIEDANVVILDTPSLPLRRPLKILTTQQWSLIKVRGTGTTIPEWLYYDDGYNAGAGSQTGVPTGNGKISFYPVPESPNQAELFTWGALALVPSITASLDFPPGYLEMLYTNLAKRLASQWGKTLRPDVVDLAKDSLATVQAHNAPTPQMQPDPGCLSSEGSQNFGDFNYITGDLN